MPTLLLLQNPEHCRQYIFQYQTQMLQQSVSPPTCFSFKYFINLGDGRFGSMDINEKSNLYQQAENFCRLHHLDPYIAVLLENEMFQEVLRIQEQNSVHHGASVGKIHKNKLNEDEVNQGLATKAPGLHSREKNRNSGSIEHQKVSVLQQKQGEKVSNCSARKTNSRHFEQMFKRHEEIENKKEMSRKKSLEKITFQPTINNLSRKIVDLKRSTMSRDHSFGHKVYSIRLDKNKLRQEEACKQNRSPHMSKPKAEKRR